jgi:hypothetical protein
MANSRHQRIVAEHPSDTTPYSPPPVSIFLTRAKNLRDEKPEVIRYVRWDLVKQITDDILDEHADPTEDGYNHCDQAQCLMCERAKALYPR